MRQFLQRLRAWQAVLGAGVLLLLSLQSAFAGASMETYISEIDGSEQPYGLYIPEPFDPDVPHPVVVYMHGYGSRAGTNFWISSSDADANGWILANVDSRGNVGSFWVGEKDVFEVLDDLRARFNVDEGRLYVYGCSMGGWGALLLGFRHPHTFAAACGIDGTYDWSAGASEPSLIALRQAGSPLHIAENSKQLNKQILADTSDLGSAQMLQGRLDELGYSYSFHENVGGGHCGALGAMQSEITGFFSQHVNDPNPKDVVLKANQLKYGSAHWVRMDRLERSGQFAIIRAKIAGKGKDRVEVTASGVLQYTLFLTPEVIALDELVSPHA